MKDESKTKKQLLAELNQLRQQVDKLESRLAERRKKENSKNTLKTLEYSEERYLCLAKNIPGITYQYIQYPNDVSGEFPYISQGITTLCELDPEDVHRDSNLMWSLIHREDIEEFTKSIELAASAIKQWDHEWRIVTPSGKTKWIKGLATPDRRSDGSMFWDGLLLDITDRKEAEEALRKSEEEFRHVYEHMAIGVARVSLDYRIETANDAYCSMLGYSEKELIGKHLKDITHPEILDENLLKQSKLARGEIDHFRMDKSFIHKNGRVISGILDANLIRDVDGKPLYFIGSVLDITDRVEAEEKIKESEKKFSTIFESNPAAVAITRLSDNRIVDVNRYWEMTTGYARSEVIGHHPHEFHLWVEPKSHEKLINQLQEKQKATVDEIRIRKKSGEIRFFMMSSEIFEMLDEKFLITMSQDITDHKHALEKVKSAKAFMDTVVDRSPFAMWIADHEGTVIRTNHSLRKTLKMADEMIIGKYNVLEDANLENQGVMPLVKSVFDEHEAVRFIIPWKADEAGEVDFQGGKDLHIDASIFPILSGAGELINVVCQWVDITNLKKAEDTLRESEEKYRLLVERV